MTGIYHIESPFGLMADSGWKEKVDKNNQIKMRGPHLAYDKTVRFNSGTFIMT